MFAHRQGFLQVYKSMWCSSMFGKVEQGKPAVRSFDKIQRNQISNKAAKQEQKELNF